MAWTPTRNIIIPRAIPDNLVAYCLDPTRQGEALTWAGNGSLKVIQTAQNNFAERDKPIYPCIVTAEDEDAQDAEDLITGAYVTQLELRVQNANPDTAVSQARTYAKALMSMIANCPMATFLTNTGADSGVLLQMETKFQIIKVPVNDRANDFRQDVSFRLTYELHGAANS